MKYLILPFFFLFLACSAFGQVDLISLPLSNLELDNDAFQIVQVKDSRPDTTYIGNVFTGYRNKPALAKLKGGNQNSIRDFVINNFPAQRETLMPIYMSIDNFEIAEGDFEVREYGLCKLTVSFYANADYSGAPMYKTSSFISDTITDVYPTHVSRIRRAFKVVLTDFLNNGFRVIEEEEYVPVFNEERFTEKEVVHVASEKEQIEREKKRKEEQLDSSRNYSNNTFGGRNIVSLGYQIGGWTAIGAEMEFRLSDLIGVNVGLGYRGFTGGLKFHISPSKNSLFISPNFKDGGFGHLGSFCLEVGGRMPFKKRSYDGWGFQLQGGFQRVMYISNEFKDQQQNLTGSSFEVGSIALSIGLGFSF